VSGFRSPWAQTQNNLGNALGQRESETARLEEAVAAYRAALEERTRERVPLYWAESLGNQGVALAPDRPRPRGRKGDRVRSPAEDGRLRRTRAPRPGGIARRLSDPKRPLDERDYYRGRLMKPE
jgi:hypothetical protein